MIRNILIAIILTIWLFIGLLFAIVREDNTVYGLGIRRDDSGVIEQCRLNERDCVESIDLGTSNYYRWEYIDGIGLKNNTQYTQYLAGDKGLRFTFHTQGYTLFEKWVYECKVTQSEQVFCE